MKRAFFALLSAVLLITSIQPASAAVGYITVRNLMSSQVKVDIIYRTHLCRDDHPTIAPGGAFGTKTGMCMIDHMTVSWAWGKCGPGVQALGAPLFLIHEKQHPHRCQVEGKY